MCHFYRKIYKAKQRLPINDAEIEVYQNAHEVVAVYILKISIDLYGR